MFDYPSRLARVQAAMTAAGLDLIFLNLSANLQYLTGIAREEPNYGNTMYPGEWLTGVWIPRQGAPILTLPRMLADFHLGHIPGYDVRVLPDAGDPAQLAADVLRALRIQGAAQRGGGGSRLGGDGAQPPAPAARSPAQPGVRDPGPLAADQGRGRDRDPA